MFLLWIDEKSGWNCSFYSIFSTVVKGLFDLRNESEMQSVVSQQWEEENENNHQMKIECFIEDKH